MGRRARALSGRTRPQVRIMRENVEEASPSGNARKMWRACGALGEAPEARRPQRSSLLGRRQAAGPARRPPTRAPSRRLPLGGSTSNQCGCFSMRGLTRPCVPPNRTWRPDGVEQAGAALNASRSGQASGWPSLQHLWDINRELGSRQRPTARGLPKFDFHTGRRRLPQSADRLPSCGSLAAGEQRDASLEMAFGVPAQ